MADAPNIEQLSAQLQKSFNPDSTSRDTPQGAKKANKAVGQNGLLTPESTPDVDDARLKADAKRRLTEERSSKQLAVEAASYEDGVPHTDLEPSTTHQPVGSTRGPLDAVSEGEKAKESSDSSVDTEMKDEEASRARTLKEILACENDEYLKILGLTPRTYSNKTEEQGVLEKAYYDRGVLVYAAVRSTGDAGDARKAWNSKSASFFEQRDTHSGCSVTGCWQAVEMCRGRASRGR